MLLKYHSPVLAVEWVTALVKEINDHMRLIDKGITQKKFHYLIAKLQDSKVASTNVVLVALLEDNMKKNMLAELDDEYIFKTISPAMEPEEKMFPNRPLIVIIITFIGFVLACFAALSFGYIDDSKKIKHE